MIFEYAVEVDIFNNFFLYIYKGWIRLVSEIFSRKTADTTTLV